MRGTRLGASGSSESIATWDGRGHAVFVCLNNDAHGDAVQHAPTFRLMVDARC
jgi:uncharacterized protein YecE (DUF72 family)